MATEKDERNVFVSMNWNEQQSNILDSFQEFRNNGDFFDVTLVVEEEQISAHKVILAASSSYMKTLLKRTNDQNPTLIMPSNVRFVDFQKVLQIMYTGSVYVKRKDLKQFQELVRFMKIKGLVDEEENENSTENEGSEPYAKNLDTPSPGEGGRGRGRGRPRGRGKGGSAIQNLGGKIRESTEDLNTFNDGGGQMRETPKFVCSPAKGGRGGRGGCGGASGSGSQPPASSAPPSQNPPSSSKAFKELVHAAGGGPGSSSSDEEQESSTSEKKYQYFCDMCRKKFQSPDSVLGHIKRQHPWRKGEPPHGQEMKELDYEHASPNKRVRKKVNEDAHSQQETSPRGPQGGHGSSANSNEMTDHSSDR